MLGFIGSSGMGALEFEPVIIKENKRTFSVEIDGLVGIAKQMFRRMVFNICACNCDDHTKNFAFRLKEDGVWELAPAYDLCHAYRPDSKWVSRHALSVNGKRENILKEDLLKVGESIKNRKAKQIIEEISDSVSQWKNFANKVNVDTKLRDEIDKTLTKFV